MPFSEYKNLGNAIKEFNLNYKEQVFEDVLLVEVPQNLVEDIAFNLLELVYDGSEAIICETLIFPVLKEVWKEFRKELMLWSHQAIEWNAKLSGIPDYMFTKQSVLGKVVMDKPYLAVVEAKKDDFSAGWGQCTAEMYAVQQINEKAGFYIDKKTGLQVDLMIFGIVCNGKVWEFASLQKNNFIKYTNIADINNLKELYSLLRHILKSITNYELSITKKDVLK